MRPRPLLPLLALILTLPVSARSAEPATSAAGPDFSLEAFAAVGSSYAEDSRFTELGWSPAQFDAFLRGLRDAFERRPHPLSAEARSLQDEIGRRLQLLAAEEAQRMREFFKDPARRESYMKQACKVYRLERADSGLAFRLQTQGSSIRPEPDATVVVSYSVTAPDGKTRLPQLDAKQLRSKIADLLPGLAEVVQMMTLRDTAMVVLPPELSFGTDSWPAGIDRDIPLLFVIELEQIVPNP